MGKRHAIWSSFTGGEYSPLVEGQVAWDAYFRGCKKLQNMLPHPQGPAGNRPGTKYIAAAKESDKKCRLIPFEFSTEQAYQIELGDTYARFFRNKGQVVSVDANTMLLLEMEGKDASTTITDDSPTTPHTITVHGNAKLTTDKYKFGNSSLQLLNSADYLTLPDDADFTFTSKIFTVDAWIYINLFDTLSEHYIYCHNTTAVPHYHMAVTLLGDNVDGSTGRLRIIVYDGAWQIVMSSTSISKETWTHIKVCADGTYFYLFINGFLDKKPAITATIMDYNDPVTIGNKYYGGNNFNGYIDELRVSDSCRNTSDFTPPTTAYTVNPSGTVYEIATTYTEEQLPVIKHAQSADILYLTESNHEPATLTRSAHTNWTLADFGYMRGPFKSVNVTSVTITPSADTGAGITLTASSATFLSTHVGSLWRVKDGVVLITAYTNATTVTATVQAEPTGVAGDLNTGPAAVTDWAEAAWSDDEGWPTAVTFYEDRLWFAKDQTLYASKSGDYTNFKTGTAAADALVYTIGSGQVNSILWLSSGKIMVVGTSGGEYKVSASNLDEVITPTNVRVARQSYYGCADYQPVPVKDVVLYLQRAQRQIREFTYKFESDSYVSPDLTVLAEHITKDYITYMAYQASPLSILWCIRNDGVMVGLTYNGRQITAWHSHVTDGSFESVSCIPGLDNYDELWVVVKRTDGDGNTVRFIEMLEKFEDSETLSDHFVVDCGLSYDGVETSIISGLSHLNGKTVAILADGLVQNSKVVNNGTVALDTAASKAQIGLAFTQILQTMRPDPRDGKGTAQGRMKAVNQFVLRLLRSVTFKYGKIPDDIASGIENKDFRVYSNTDIFTGDTIELTQVEGLDQEGYITIYNDKPVPLTVVAIMPEVNTP